MDQELTDLLTDSVSHWITLASVELARAGLEQNIDALLHYFDAQNAEVEVVFKVRDGAIELHGVNKATASCGLLYRQEIEPLRPWTPFGEPGNSCGH